MKKHDFGKPLCRLIMAVAIMMLSLQAMAYDFYYTYQGRTLYYNITSENTVAVTYRGPYSSSGNNYVSGDVVIPTTVIRNGTTYSVTSIGYRAFRGCSGLTSITIPNSVTSIRGSAFEACSGLTTLNFNAINCQDFSSNDSTFGTSLTTVNIGGSVLRIPKNFVRGCSGLTTLNFNAINCQDFISNDSTFGTSLTTVNIGDSVRRIPANFVRGCSGLTSVTIPNSVTSIGGGAFSGCSGLTTLNFNAINCQDFEAYYAYYDYNGHYFYPFSGISLTTVNIGDSVQRIPANFVRGCSSLTTLNFNAINCQDFEDSYFNGNYCGSFGNSLTTVNIGDSVQRIPANFVKGCRRLTSITIPNSVTSIRGSAFRGCSGLTTLNFNAINCQDFEDSYFNGNYCGSFGNSLTTVNIGDSVQRIPAHFVKFCRGLTSVTIPNGVTSIGEKAFEGCSGLTSVNIGNGVTSIGYYAFNGCSGLTSVTIPNSVTSIGNSAFEDCSGLTSVNVASGNTHYSSIDGVLYNYVQDTLIQCPGAKTSITIPNSVTFIGDYAFSGCDGLTSITIPNSVTFIGDYAFSGCDGLTSITIPNSVTSIGKSAFVYCSRLTTLNFNAINCQDFEAYYNYYPFSGTSLTTVNIGDSVQRIPANFVPYCSGLTSVSIPNSVTSIGGGAFYGCSGLTSVTIPNSVTSIGGGAFSGCSGLTSVTIPNSVTSIGEQAFRDCSGLTSVRCLASAPPSIGSSSFSGISSTCTLTVSCVSFDAYVGSDWNTYFGGRILEDSTEEFSFELTASANDLTAGSVDISIGERCDQRILTATPESCYRFNAWSDGNRSNPRIITLTQDTAFTAYFDRAVYTQAISHAICEGSVYTENGFNVSEAGTYTQNLQTVNGCDSIVTLTLTVNPVESTTLSAAICEGTSYTENGFNVSEAGTYTQNLQTVNGCDRIVTLTLTVNPTYNITIDASINEGETYEENGFSESEAGTYVHTLQSEFGCDSVITLNLTVNSSLNDVVANAVEIRLYPNPAKSFVNMEFEALKENTLLQIFDINGRKVRTFDLKAGVETLRIDLGDLPKGVYTIMIGNVTKKLIVE